MAGTLAQKTAVVTGASRGIGAAIARSLAGAGARVVVVARTESDIEAVARELAGGRGQAFAFAGDVAFESVVRGLGAFAREKLGTVDILVNNAGDSASALFHRIGLGDWNRTMAVNVTTTFLCTREFAPAMVTRGMGRVINLASVAGLEGAKYVAHYCAAKHAVVGFTRALAVEYEGTGVTVNAICPAYVDTPMTERTIANVQTRTGMAREEALAAVLATSGQERLLRPAEVADAVLALCQEAAANRTGETVVLRPAGSPA
jgi:NAD(P)-dependent dehydrogenase (short-subunit alcohol dehydrogenase family)